MTGGGGGSEGYFFGCMKDTPEFFWVTKTTRICLGIFQKINNKKVGILFGKHILMLGVFLGIKNKPLLDTPPPPPPPPRPPRVIKLCEWGPWASIYLSVHS